MKRLVWGVAILLIAMGARAQSFDAVKWVEENFSKVKVPPVSFMYAGKESGSFIRSWNFKKEKLPLTDPARQDFVVTWCGKGMEVTCEITCWLDFPAVEWLMHFKNTSDKNSGQLTQVKVINHAFKTLPEGPVILHHSLGSAAQRSDFMTLRDELTVGKNVYMTPAGGRSSDNTAFPFFNMEFPGGQGVIAAIGWTGKWYANVIRKDASHVGLASGMERMNLYLEPGEQIRTPRIALLFWKGSDRMAGHNQFRQFILAHHTWQIDGKPAELPFAAGLGANGPAPCNEYSCTTENYAIAQAYRLRQFGIVPEVLWIDAGWYTGCGAWWSHVGNWTVNKVNFPNGLKPVTDAVHEVGAKFILWFEPERVYRGTQWDTELGKWLIRIPDSVKREPYNRVNKENAMFNLGDPAACAWLTQYIGDLIEKEGIDYYRQDFNFDPWLYWMYNDPPGRDGISEIRHIEGLYAYWDGLHKRFPRMIIDNCASGGRRIDLETVSRSSPLWRTDYNYGEPNGYQCHTYGLSFYLPMHGTGNIELNNYTFRSSLSTAMVTNWDVERGGFSVPQLQKYVSDYKRLRPYFYADFYPLTPNQNITSDSIWLSYQLNRPKENDGIILAFRRPACPVDRITVRLRGLEPEAKYELLLEDENKTVTLTGKELMDQFEMILNEKNRSLLISYKKL